MQFNNLTFAELKISLKNRVQYFSVIIFLCRIFVLKIKLYKIKFEWNLRQLDELQHIYIQRKRMLFINQCNTGK